MILRCYLFLLFRHSGLRPPERAILQVRVEREAAGASQGHCASRLAHVYNPRLLWPVQYPFGIVKSVSFMHCRIVASMCAFFIAMILLLLWISEEIKKTVLYLVGT